MPALAENSPDQPPAALTMVVPRISPVVVRMPATALPLRQDLQGLAVLQQTHAEPARRGAIGIEHGVVMDDGVAMHESAGGPLAAVAAPAAGAGSRRRR